MSEIKSELDEMEQTNYSINSNNMDPKNNEELIIYVSSSHLFTFLSRYEFQVIFFISQLGSEFVTKRSGQISVHVRADNIKNRRYGQSVNIKSPQS